MHPTGSGYWAQAGSVSGRSLKVSGRLKRPILSHFGGPGGLGLRVREGSKSWFLRVSEGCLEGSGGPNLGFLGVREVQTYLEGHMGGQNQPF